MRLVETSLLVPIGTTSVIGIDLQRSICSIYVLKEVVTVTPHTGNRSNHFPEASLVSKDAPRRGSR